MLQHMNLREGHNLVHSDGRSIYQKMNEGKERNTISILGMMSFDIPMEKARRQLIHQLGDWVGLHRQNRKSKSHQKMVVYKMGIDGA